MLCVFCLHVVVSVSVCYVYGCVVRDCLVCFVCMIVGTMYVCCCVSRVISVCYMCLLSRSCVLSVRVCV